MKNFNEIIEKVLEHEGGYVNDPTDLGGETKYGITKRFYPNVDIKNLTIEQAKEIYKKLRAVRAIPGTFTFLNCFKIKVIDGYVNKKIHGSLPGTILSIDNTIVVACGNKTSFSITHIQKPGKRQLDTKTFLKGFSIKEGDCFD